MKGIKKIFSVLLVVILCALPMTVGAVDRTETVDDTVPLGRQWITDENLGTGVVGTSKNRATVGSNVVITPGTSIYYGSWVTCKFTINSETGTYLGFCAEPNSATPNGTYKVSKLDNKIIEGLVLTYVIPELWNKIGVNFYTPGYEYVFCHAAIGYVYTGSLKGLSTQAANGIRAIVADITNIINGTNGYAGSEKTRLLNQYLKDYELHIAYNSNQDIVWIEKIPEVSTSLKLVKKQEGTDIPILGAKFQHRNPDGTSEILTTDKDGQLSLSRLLYGQHCLQEIEAPEGYLLNETIIDFEVDKYGIIKVNSEEELKTQGILFDIKSESKTKKNISFTVYEKTMPYSLIIHKENENQIKLEGAEYALYLENDCLTEVASGVTDVEGLLKFDGLTMGTSYYLKENTAPTGYRPQVDEAGNSIVTEIRVTAIPIEDKFHLYVNGIEYDFHTEGAFSISGTKAAPEISLNEVNEVGIKLPETGSVQTLVGAIIAITFLTISLFREKEKI